MIEKQNMRKYMAELMGTAALVFIGCGSAVIAGDQIGFLGISLAFGLILLVMVYTIGNISGCHINPAVTIAMHIARKIEKRDAIYYIIMQCVGAILGAGLLLLIAEGSPDYSLSDNGLGQNGYDSESPMDYEVHACFIAEVVLTALFLIVIFASTDESAPKGFAGISIGLSLVLIHLVGIPITGTSVNPARSLGPAIFAGETALLQVWLFFAAPIAGAVIATFIWKYMFEEEKVEAAPGD